MELLRNIGIQERFTATGKSNKRTYGIFICPVCKLQVERPITKGAVAKSCGAAECRKAAYTYNTNSAHSKASKATARYNKPYYHVIKIAYNKIENAEFTITEFYDYVIADYTRARIQHPSAHIVCDGDPQTLANYTVMTTSEAMKYATQARVAAKLEAKLYDSNMLVHITNKTPQVVRTAINKYNSRDDITDKIDVQNVIDVNIRNKNTKAIVLTETQYDILTHGLRQTRKDASDKLYFIRQGEGVKIGISNNVDKRLQSLKASSIEEYTLLKTYNITNARQVETYLHKLYADKNIKFEWFKLTESELEDVYAVVECTLDGTKWLHPTSNIHTIPVWTPPAPKTPVVKETYDIVTENIKVARVRTALPQEAYKLYDALKVTVGGAKNLPDTLNSAYKLWGSVQDKMKAAESEGKTTIRANQPVKSIDDVYFVDGKKASATATTRAVMSTDSNGVETIYPSAREAASSIKGTPAHITACCKGKRKTHKGYSWRYAS